jgi:transglutaminase-like putative cysteine protease
MRARHLLLLPALIVLASGWPAGALGNVVLHEQISADPRDDLAMSVALEGDLPAAIETPSGVVGAPDPGRPVQPRDRTADDASDAYGRRFDLRGISKFVPDKDTRRPDVLPYDDPFTPSTAPFKRLVAFDAVDASFALTVRDPRQQPLAVSATPAADGSDEQFYGNLVVDVGPGRRARIPSVGPDAKIMHAHLGVGVEELPLSLYADGAGNWFLEADRPARARLVFELTIPRETFGGEFSDPGWGSLPTTPPLPSNVAADANKVALHIGVSRALSPRENVKRMVEYFRGFADSEQPPSGHGDVYLDLALSRKGVCRHRAYAFLVTALGLGLPARMVMNEAHAWVEVHDGALWKRIDLGGAGRTLAESLASEVPYQPPPDPFAWPPSSTRGDDLAARARFAAGRAGSGGTGRGSGTGTGSATGGSGATASSGANLSTTADARPPADVRVGVADADAHRGGPLHVRGEVHADGAACPHVVVDVVLRAAKGGRERFLGTLATGEDGTFAGALVVPAVVALGDYDVIARTPGDARCGEGGSK